MKKIIIIFCLTGIIKPEIYDVSIPENDTASYNYADFRLWHNDSTDTLKGIYWFMHPNNGDSRNIVSDSSYQMLVDEYDFALMGARIFNMHMDTGIGDAVIAAMDSFATLSNHDEISFLPFFINGFSWGGQFGYHFAKWIPERVLGFITQKGGYHDTTYAGSAIEVPGLMIVGENDMAYRIENLTGIFLDHRPAGAKWILAMEPNAGHTLVNDQLLDNYFYSVINHRLPDDANVFEPINLNSLNDSIGWLGDQRTYTIGSWDCYEGVFDSSSWFPSKEIGLDWQNFVSELPADTSDCEEELNTDYTSPINFKVHNAFPNPFNPITTIKYSIQTNGLVEAAVYNIKGRQIEKLFHGYLNKGEHSLHWNGINQSSGIYFLELLNNHHRAIKKMILLK